MKRIDMVIENCEDCPYWDENYSDVDPSYEPWCFKSDREVVGAIPDWCELEDA